VIAEASDEDERERIAAAARRSPGEKLYASLRLSDEMLPWYRRLLQNAAIREAEGARALDKARLHALWRRHQEER
jgi:hypothetical protein